ncbi:MAG: hypothetical protein ABIK09_14585 [Pseudomonadota bacterium]
MSPARRNRVILVAVTALLVVGAVVIKVHVEGTRAMATADAAWDKSDMDRAQLLYLRAGRWYLPGNGVREAAAGRLLELARTRLEAHDWPGAVSAYDDVRALYYGSSSLAKARGETLDAANSEMAGALAAWKRASGSPETKETLETRYLSQLIVHDIPSPLWSLVMGLALLGWLGTLGGFAWRYDALRLRWPWLVASACFFIVWGLALHLMGP